ncbi:MAG TPA: acetoacetate decarboxylase [Burkholderiales bacterium]|jgi:acetoacetate decarboxylase|nr:acetoacetate decarboxylase [Burkholderiales bacterium]
MKIEEIQKNAFGMPFCSPSASKIEYKMTNREYFIISYETDYDALQAVVPEPLKVVSNVVKMEFMKMPDANGFGSFQEAGQQIEVEFEGKKGAYAHAMYVNDVASISAGREIWGYPKKYASPELKVDVDTLLGTLKYNSTIVAAGSMGYKYQTLDSEAIRKNLEETPIFMLKIIPHVNLKEAAICQLTKCFIADVKVHGAWSGPCDLQLFNHALATLNQLPVRKIIGASYFIADVNLIGGEVAFDYLKK